MTEEKSAQDIEKELNDKYLRLMAEVDNFKKRTSQRKNADIYNGGGRGC